MASIIASNSSLHEPIIYFFASNTRIELLDAIGIMLIITIGLRLISHLLMAILDLFAHKTKTEIDDIALRVLKAFKTPFYFVVALYFGTMSLNMAPSFENILRIIFLITTVYYVSKVVYVFVDQALKRYSRMKVEANEDDTQVELIRVFSKVFLICIAVLFFLANMGVNITSLIAGLGIGGIAIAFALQQVLSDIFSSLSIYFDKPFKRGDFIIIGTDMGVVEKIGIQTTRIKTLQGQMMSIPNSELTKSRINNFKQMQRRRVSFVVGVEYGTPRAQVAKIPKVVEQIIKRVEQATFDRAFFKEFGPSSLNFEIVYFVETKDILTYLQIQQKINLDIMEYFEAQGIAFAFPTQTVHVINQPQSKTGVVAQKNSVKPKGSATTQSVAKKSTARTKKGTVTKKKSSKAKSADVPRRNGEKYV